MVNAADSLLRELCLVLKSSSTNSTEYSDALSSLSILFPAIAVGALDIIDNGSVLKLQTVSGRHIFQVSGSSGSLFHCFDIERPSCCCSIFKANVSKSPLTDILCKHLLAIKIAQHLDRVTVRNIADESHYIRLVKASMFDELLT